MENKSQRVSSKDFSKLIAIHRPNIIAYAAMLWAGELKRDVVILKAMAAICERRKEYRPSEWPDFCGWCYTQIADQIVSNDSHKDVADFARSIRDTAARSLPATALRMDAFDKAFFELPGKDKEILSISCQHHRLQDQFITKLKGMSRDEFDKKVENLKLALLITTAWKKPHSGSSRIMPAENLALLRYVANSPGEEGNVATRGMLLENEAMLDQYILHVALQQSLMTRLLDEPGAELRSEDKKQEKSFKRRLVCALFLLIILLPLLFVSSSKGSGAHNEVKRLAYSVIPEPSSVSMLAVGLGALLMRRSRENKI